MFRVIIADDENKICLLLKNLINWEEMGFEIIGVEHDGESLLQSVMRDKPDLVITDVRMPEMSGVEFLHCLRERQMNTRVVIMSGYREFEYVQSALKDGALDYILKPLNRESIQETLGTVRRNLEEQSASAQSQASLRQQAPGFRWALIQEILDGRLTEATPEELSRQYEIDISEAVLYAVAVKFDILLPQDNIEYGIGETVANIVTKEANQWKVSGFIGIRDNYCYMLLDGTVQREMERNLYHLIHELQDYFGTLEYGDVTIGIAPVKDNRLSIALQESRYAAMDQIYRGVNRVLSYMPHSEGERAPVVDRESDHVLRRAFRTCDYAGIYSEMSSLLNQIRERGRKRESGKRLYDEMVELQSYISDVVRYLFRDDSINALLEKYAGLLSSCCSWDAYSSLFSKQLGELMASIEAYRDRQNTQPIRRVQRFVEERYAENISLGDVAEELGMNADYISRLFKKETGMTFTKFLNRVRLNHAKDILKTSDAPISEVALKVGYSDEKYFMRVFKKEEALTVSEYKRLYGD